MTAQRDDAQRRQQQQQQQQQQQANRDSGNTTSDALNDEPPPSYTIIENVPERLPKESHSACCGRFPERTFVLTILFIYAFLSLLYIGTALFDLPDIKNTRDSALKAISLSLSLAFLVSSLVGINQIYKENARVFKIVSIVFFVLTVLNLVFNASYLIIVIVVRKDLINLCANNEGNQSNFAAAVEDCTAFINLRIILDAITLLFVETLQLYFAHVIYRYARHISRRRPVNVIPKGNGRDVGEMPPTYVVYAARVPTATDWVPPPMYNGNPNNVPLAEHKETV